MMAGEMWRVVVVLLVVAATAGTARAICPSRCRCNEDALQVSCASAGLAVVPIQLNPEVRTINLAGNKITSVHFTLGFYDKLVGLDLSRNRIASLGAGNFDVQRNMKHLNLSHNDLEVLAKDSFKGLKALVTLDLGYNRLERIAGHAFRDLHSLEMLRLTGNQLMHLEAGLLKPATLLRELLLEGNQLLDVPEAIADVGGNLQHLALSNNLIASVDEGVLPLLPELLVLRLDGNVISDIHPGALSGLTALDHLDLSNNNFSSVPTGSLAKLSNLTQLTFSENFIAAVPPVAFRGLFQLRALHLNRLDFLTHVDARAFVDNINLEHVLLDDNVALEVLPHRLFHGNPHLSVISVRNNRLVTLDASHFPLDQLVRLHVGGNPFQCNCSLLWLWRLAQDQRGHLLNTSTTTSSSSSEELVIDIEDIECEGPEPLRGALLADASESQVGCSLGWIAVAGGIAFTFLLLGAAVGVLYCRPLRKRIQKADLPPIDAVSRPNGTTMACDYDTANIYEDPRMDKYIIGPPIIHEYHALPPWEPCSKQHCNDVYKQFDNTIKSSRPHIVYV